MNKNRTPSRSVVVLAILAMISALLFSASPAGSQDDVGDDVDGGSDPVSEDPIGGPAPVDPGLSDAEIAALEAEHAAELAASGDGVTEGTPIVPQGTNASLDDGEVRVDDNQAGLVDDDAILLDSQPAGGAAVVPNYADPEPGTSATISFADAGSGSVADLLAADVQLTKAVQEEIDTAKRSRVVRVSAADLNADLAAENLSVELFPDVTLDMVTNVAPSPGQMGSTVSSAVPADGSDGNPFGIVTVIDDRVYGGWWIGNSAYEMIPLGNGDHLLFEVGKEFDGDPEHWDMPPGPDNGPSGLTGAELGITESEGGDLGADVIEFPNVDVLVGIDAEARAALGSSQAAVDLAILNVNLTNMTYLNSGAEAPQNMTLVSVYETGFTPVNNDGVLYRNQLAAKADGTFDAIHTVRDANFADLVVVIFERTMFSGATSLCGIAFFPTSANPAENDAYQITKRSCATTTALTFPHEFGHNQCAGHDSTGGGCSFYTVDNGYVDAGTAQRTIMARNSNTCCTRRPVWSNPSITWNGWTPGVASTDNNFVLEQEDRAPGTVSGGVADYRVNPLGDAAVAGNDGVSCIYNTIEDAVSFSPPGSTIYIAPGTYPAQTTGINYNVAKDLDLVQGTSLCRPAGAPAATGVILQRAVGDVSTDAVFEVSGSGVDVTLDRITVQGATGTEGNIQVFSGSTLTLDDALVRNANTTGDGGGIRVLAGGTLISVDDTQIENNSTTGNGGGVWTSGGTVNLNGLGDVDNNTASGNGGGVYAAAGANVTVQANADVLQNTAANGGGVYADNSTVLITGGGTFVGFNLQGNTATSQGGGVYSTNSATVTLAAAAEIEDNSASFAGGARATSGGTVVVNNGVIESNDATSGGGGMYGSAPHLFDLNPGAIVRNNTTTGFGGGIVSFGTVDIDGGTGTPDFVEISGNSAATQGGGVYVGNGTSNHDTVHIHNNSAANGGGAYVAGGALNVNENWNCDTGDTGFEEYCNEFRGNSATTDGAAAFVAGGVFNVDTIGFIGNTTADNTVLAAGSSDVDIRAAMFLSNTTTGGADGVVTAVDTANINIIGVTFADNTELAVDSDGVSTVWNVARVITDNGAYGLTNQTGSCNLRQSGSSGTLPGAFTVDVRFETGDHSDYTPGPLGPAADRCAQLGGHASDALDFGVKDADGVASATEWDVGGIESDRQPIITPGAIGGAEGNSGVKIFPVPVRLDVAHSEPITIDWFTWPNPPVTGIATPGVDYIADAGTVTFLPGSTQETVDITVIGDTVPEVNAFLGEWVPIVFTNPSENAELNLGFFGLGLAIIGNDDGPPP